MDIESIGKNETLVHTREKIILVSYKTNVACYDKISGTLYRTDNFHSRTTDKHINKFMNMIYTNWKVYSVEIMSQSELDNLLDRIGDNKDG